MTQTNHELAQVSHQLDVLRKQHADERVALQQKFEEGKSTLLVEKCLNDWEEEKMVLISQVNSYSRQCEELKKNFGEKVGNLEEEKLVLTQQVKAYSRQCEELKKTMVQLQEKSKTLEEQVYHKERIATEVHVMYVTN